MYPLSRICVQLFSLIYLDFCIVKTPIDKTVFVCDLNLTANLKWVDLPMLFVFYSGRHIDLNGAFVSKVGMPITFSLFESLSLCRQNIGFSICHIYLSLSCMNSFIHSKLIHNSGQAKSQEDYFYEIDKLRPTSPVLTFFFYFRNFP